MIVSIMWNQPFESNLPINEDSTIRENNQIGNFLSVVECIHLSKLKT